jgi:AcrR family transcriptional regulator
VPRRLNASKEQVLSQTLSLISQHDIPGVSIDMIAALTKVSKSTIYRFWSSKEELIFDALSQLKLPVEVPDSGDIAKDLKTCLRRLISFLNDPEVGPVFAAFLNAAIRNPKLAKYRGRLAQRAVQPFETLINRSVEAGTLRLRLPMHLAIDILISPFAYRKIATSLPLNLSDADHVVEFFISANAPE